MQNDIHATIEALRAQSPLVHNITNYVVMQVTANALLAAGASPLMAHAPEELEDLLSIASALVLNIGTLDKAWLASMEKAGIIALSKNVPTVLDPVGAGASRLRTDAALHLLDIACPAVVRGNGSEIMALAPKLTGTDAATKGVDSTRTAIEAKAAALDIARRHHCVVSISGAEDLITNGICLARVRGGSPLMPLVTGLGCTATALTAACIAVAPSHFIGATAAMAIMAEAGENAAASAKGPGSFLPLFFDALYNLSPAHAATRVTEE